MSKAVERIPGDEGRRTKDASRAPSFVLRPSSFVIGWRGDVLLALAAGLLAMLLLSLAYARVWPLAVDIGTRDNRFIAGFNATEDFGGRLVRWTGGDATIALPRPPDGRPALLSITLLNSRPDGSPDPHVALSADGRPLAVFDVGRTRGESGIQTYQVLLPGGVKLDWATRIRLQSDTIALPNDPRPLGVVVDRVALTPLDGGLRLPSLWLLCWGMLLGGLGYGFARSIGLSRALAWALVVLLAALLAIGVALRPMETLPFVQRVALLPGVGCLGIWLARLLTPAILTTDDRRPTTGAPSHTWSLVVSGRWSVRGADLPIYLAVLWWMGPLWQWVETADGAVNVTPAPTTSWIGGALALGLLGLAGWYALRGRKLALEQRASTLRRVALVLFVVAALAHLVYMIWFAFQRQGPDFWILFKGARDWARGGSLYDLDAIIENHFGHVFKVPPFYGMLFLPFVFQDGERILLFHRIINVILLSTIALVWFRMWNVRVFSAAGAGVLILLNFRPMADTIAFGQIDLALLLALTLAIWALRNEHDLLAGALVALGTLFKVYPLLLLAFFVVKRRWWALAGFVLGMLVLNGLSIAVIGWEMHRVYLFEVLPRIGGTTSWVENQTISGFLARLLVSPLESTIFHNRPIELLGLAIGGAVGLLACLLALRPARSTSTSFALQYGVFALVMVLTVPAAWMHYETLLFLPFAALLLHTREQQIGLTRTALLAISFALASYGNQWSYFDGTLLGVLTVLGVSYKFYGMLLLGGVLTATLLEGWIPSWRDLAQFIPWRRGLSGSAQSV
ncbi:MAG: glycosyltransferase family 87 protein [Roseiflexaceae bacterium]